MGRAAGLQARRASRARSARAGTNPCLAWLRSLDSAQSQPIVTDMLRTLAGGAFWHRSRSDFKALV